MRLATFNVENLFDRPLIMNQDNVTLGKRILSDHAELNELIGKTTYSAADKAKMITLMSRYPGLIANEDSTYIRLRIVRGKLLRKSAPPLIVAKGRADWIGWFELKTGAVDEVATENTARVIGELKADVLCVVEAEDRIALKHFNSTALPKVHTQPFEHVMLVDGNDERGIDVGILVHAPYSIERMGSHVDDADSVGEIFSRDCAEYLVTSESGTKILVLLNHFKSKGFGSQASSDSKRLRQAKRVREIYTQRREEGFKYIAVLGDLNDEPTSPALQELLAAGLVDVAQDPKFDKGGFPGTYGNMKEEIDYILMSPELAACLLKGAFERRGAWVKVNGTQLPHFPEVTKSEEAASDHAAVWAEVDV